MHFRRSPKSSTNSTPWPSAALCQKQIYAVQQTANYSITSSASNCNDTGTSTPSALAVLHINDKVKLGWLLYREFAGLLTFKDASNIVADLTPKCRFCRHHSS